MPFKKLGRKSNKNAAPENTTPSAEPVTDSTPVAATTTTTSSSTGPTLLRRRPKPTEESKASVQSKPKSGSSSFTRLAVLTFLAVGVFSTLYLSQTGSSGNEVLEVLNRIKRAATGSSGSADEIPVSCKKPDTIAMTLDDGPGEATDKYLDVFRSQNVKVTFHFYPGIIDTFRNGALWVRRAAQEGHIIGVRFNPNLDPRKLSNSELAKELAAHSEGIKKHTGRHPKYLRFNYQQYDNRVINIAHTMGFIVTAHNIDSGDYRFKDWAGNPGGEIHRVYYEQLAASKGGSFISLHRDLNSAAATVMEDLIANVKGRGYSIITLQTCLETKDPYRGSNEVPTENQLDEASTNDRVKQNNFASSTVPSFTVLAALVVAFVMMF
ncbi:hypothetical protein BKA69DRAFT_1127489 [Paraphysoderma sedebokerense]|nr:hypothetical protein BKA69DRAFT_1127489 [Paraphysoderma sedebokerense]